MGEEEVQDAIEQQRLRELKQARVDRLDVIEKQIQLFGFGHAPSHLIVEAAKIRKEIGIVDSAVSAPVTPSISEDLQASGRFAAYYSQWSLTQERIEHLGVRLDEFISRSTVWRNEIKQWLILIIAFMFVASLVFVGFAVYVVSRWP